MGGIGAVVIYGLLVTLWGAILVLYARTRRGAADDPLLRGLLALLALDAFRSFVESLYFGLLWGGNYGVLSPLFTALSAPWVLTCVKLLNVGVAVVVLAWFIRRWLPNQLAERRAHRDAEAKLRTRLEQSLQETKQSEERLRLAAKATRDAVWDWDALTGRVWFSERMPEMLGFATQEWSLERLLGQCHPDDLARVNEETKRFVSGQSSDFSVTGRVRTKHGDERVLTASALSVRDTTGLPTRLVGFIRDHTDELAAQAALAQTQKLESVGLLAAGIAHDFNNLLAVISTSLSLADIQLSHGTPPTDLRSTLGTAASAVERAAALTRQLLAYAGRATRVQRRLDLNELVTGLSAIIGLSLSSRVKLVTQLSDRPPVVLADEAQLQQVVMNLLVNAAEAMGETEGVVTLEISVGRCEAAAIDLVGAPPSSGDCVILRVTDVGAGMSPEVRAQIFDPFFSTKGVGRGLGLAALVGILRTHQGAIGVQSALGAGTTFTVYLPLAATALQTTPAVGEVQGPAPGHALRGLHILMVDDDSLVRRGSARLLTHFGCTIEEAANGQEALDAIAHATQPFDLVLMDVTMPVLDGYSAARVMRERWPAMTVVLSSGYAEPPTGGSMPEGVHFLPKPYDRRALETLLRDLRALG
jgi:two-component system cell cycle sensor histidine kinase/response regulator CckA